MAGMNGFVHHCSDAKVSKTANKKSLTDSPFSYAQIDMLWDFYVTHTISGGSGLVRSVSDYGWKKDDNKKDGYPALEKELIAKAGLSNNICFIRSTTCKDTMSAMNLSNDEICIEHPRAVLLQKYSTTVDENEKISFSGGGENHVNCLFRHIRNSFAHGNTYFFDNGTILLEDMDKSKITAAILVRQQTLLDWIALIDKGERFYILKNICEGCKITEKLDQKINPQQL